MVSNSNISSWLQRISNITPTYHLKNFALELAKNQGLNITSLFILIVYSILFLIITVHQSQKSELDEKKNGALDWRAVYAYIFVISNYKYL